jgi:hypothetical protein
MYLNLQNTVFFFVPRALSLQKFSISCNREYCGVRTGKNLETNNETTAVVMERRGKHASTTIELLLETVFPTRSVKVSYS